MTTSTARRRRHDDDLPAGHHPSKLSRMLVWTGLVLFLIYSIAPVWFLVVSATKDQRDLYTTNGLWFADFHLLDNTRDLFTYHDSIFLRWMANTLVYGVVGTVGMTVICVACGYALAMYRFRGRGILMGCIIASFLIPGALLTIPSFLLYTRLHLVDTPWAIIVPHFFSAFSVYLAKVYAEGAVPPELLEAARVDGAGEWYIFRRIMVPMLSLPIAVVFVWLFVNVIKVFDIIYVMTSGGPGTSSQVIAGRMYTETFHGGDIGYGAAIAVVMLLLTLPVMILNVRRFRSARVIT
jgi:multiple sugar transport system permease protein